MVEWNANIAYVISYKDMNKIFSILSQNKFGTKKLTVSLNLNLSKHQVILDFEKQIVILPDKSTFKFPESYSSSLDVCYKIFEGQVYPLQYFSQETNLLYKLVPTSFRPILRVSATQMHKKPFLDHLEQIHLQGRILDAGTGLGYSAIIASKTAEKVITVEWDKNVLDIATNNPHSWALFESKNIEIIHDDVTKLIQNFENNSFDNIIQDGGTPKGSGEFFSQKHAIQLYRVLKSNGNLYFYLPKKGITKGRQFAQEQIKRMVNSGFKLKKMDKQGSFAHFIKV